MDLGRFLEAQDFTLEISGFGPVRISGISGTMTDSITALRKKFSRPDGVDPAEFARAMLLHR